MKILVIHACWFFNWHSDSGKRYIFKKIPLYGQYFVINTSINCNENQVDFHSLKDCLVWFKLDQMLLRYISVKSSDRQTDDGETDWTTDWGKIVTGKVGRNWILYCENYCEAAFMSNPDTNVGPTNYYYLGLY